MWGWLKTGIVAGALALTVQTASAADYEWKLQTFWTGGSKPQLLTEEFAKRVETASGGRIDIEVLPVGTIVPYNQSVQAVAAGILQMQFNTPGYAVGLDPAFAFVAELNAGYENVYQFLTWYYQRGGLEMARELYGKFGVYFIGPVPWGAESIPSQIPITSVEDFKNVKIRMPEGPSSDLFRMIGAAPVTVPGSEVYTSLDKGLITATDWGTLSMNQDVGLHDVAKYAIYPGIHSMPMGDLSMNLDLWNSLPDDIKQIIEAEVRVLALNMVETFESLDTEVVANAAAQGLTLIDWSPEERRKLRQVAQKVWEERSKANEMSERLYNSHMEWLKALNLL